MYSYRIRKGYESDEYLLEFTKGVESDEFLSDLKTALSEISPSIISKEDLWMNDEVLFNLNSSEGEFTLSFDVWNLAFIMAELNQDCIFLIDRLLEMDSKFEKLEN